MDACSPSGPMMAQILYTPHWCKPVFCDDPREVPPFTQALLWQSGDEYSFLLPLSVSCSAWLEGSPSGLLLVTEASPDRDPLPCAIVTRDRDPYAAIRQAFRKAAELAGIPTREDKSLPGFAKYLGWCTWDAMEIWVDSRGITDKLREFREKKVPVRWILIDDMWAEVEWTETLEPFTCHEKSFPVMHSSRLRDLEGDPDRFPGGIARCIEQIKQEGYMAGLWFPVTGYWAGLAAGSPAMEELGAFTRLIGDRRLPELADPASAEGFYSRICSRLRAHGADFIKADNQSFVRHQIKDSLPAPVLCRHLHAALDQAADKYFGGAIINCMGMANDNMFARSSAICRSSGDFQPENREWFRRHLLQCSFAGLTQGSLFFNDWDMWWTDDAQAVRNSVARAVSGGPVYVSDRIGRTRPEILEPLCLEDGRLLMCDEPAVPVRSCLLTPPDHRAFGVFSRQNDAVFVAAFNLTDMPSAPISIDPAEFGIEGPCAVCEHFSGARWIGRGECEVKDSALIKLVPIRNGAACLGIMEKYISTAAVETRGNLVVPLASGTLLTCSDGAWREIKVRKNQAVNMQQ